MLDLGEVREVAEVRVNGKDLGVVWTKPARVNITSAVKAGANELEVTRRQPLAQPPDRRCRAAAGEALHRDEHAQICFHVPASAFRPAGAGSSSG